jgi:VIT1/CCC1 family predicted Fe2+/Mn2+ transporter
MMENINQEDEQSSSEVAHTPTKLTYLAYGALSGLISALFGIMLFSNLDNFYVLALSTLVALFTGSISGLIGGLLFKGKLGCIIVSSTVSFFVTPIVSAILGFIIAMAGCGEKCY